MGCTHRRLDGILGDAAATRTPRYIIGRVHKRAAFDHTLYFQGRPDGLRAPIATGVHIKLDRTQGLVTDAPLHRTALRGKLPNQDTWI